MSLLLRGPGVVPVSQLKQDFSEAFLLVCAVSARSPFCV